MAITVIAAILAYIFCSSFISENFPNEENPLASSCFSTFNPDNCYFPNNADGRSLGFAVCKGVSLSDKSCMKKFKKADGYIYKNLCSALELNDVSVCPPVNYPYPDAMYSRTDESTDESYCIALMSACTAPKTSNNDESIVMDSCILGTSVFQPAPFQFEGDLCSYYPRMEALLEGKAKFQSAGYYPEKWM